MASAVLALGPRGMESEVAVWRDRARQGLPSHGAEEATEEEGTCSEMGRRQQQSLYYTKLLKSSHLCSLPP